MDGLPQALCRHFITDTYGTAVGVINPDAPFKVVIEGHSDEISWYVNYITDEGLIYVFVMVEVTIRLHPQMGNIHTKKGMVKGVFGWPAIHTRKTQEGRNPQTGQYFY